MSSDRKDNEQSLAEKLIKAYKLSSPLSYSESNGADAIAWANKILRQLESGTQPAVGCVEFKAAPMPGAAVKEKNCKKGHACKGTCISKNRECRNLLEGEAIKAADYLDEKVPGTATKTKAAPKKSATKAKKERATDAPAKTTKAQSSTTKTKKEAAVVDAATTAQPEVKTTSAKERKTYMQDRPNSAGQLQIAKKLVKKIPGAPPPHPEEIVALKAYSGATYYEVNGMLRGTADFTDKQRKRYTEEAEFTSAALSALPSYNGMVYRGANLSQDIIDKYKVGEVFTEKAFTSTSSKESVTDSFVAPEDAKRTVKYNIQSKKGKSIKEFSQVPEEEEILFDSNTSFKVLGKEERDGVIHLYMEEV